MLAGLRLNFPPGHFHRIGFSQALAIYNRKRLGIQFVLETTCLPFPSPGTLAPDVSAL